MNEPKSTKTDDTQPTDGTPSPATATSGSADRQARSETLRWWLKLIVQPLLFAVACGLLLLGLGVAQRFGWISAGGGQGPDVASSRPGGNVSYICPMMCTPPQTEPGRCPVCAMELVPSVTGDGGSDGRSIVIDPAARRIANIRTVAVEAIPLERTMSTIGRLTYDEGAMKTLSAYVDGRLDRLYADYTGVVVSQGDRLALLYSPRLYSGQVELLLAKQAWEASQTATLPGVLESRRNMYESSQQRLIAMGMTEQQIADLELAGEADSRLHLLAPVSGTVIEKLAVEGQYVKEGQAIYKLADLSTVWLMLELFPEDATRIRYGLEVQAEMQSLPGRQFAGRVAFIDPNVDPKTRTVGVRVVILNEEGLLRIGDYASATIQVPVTPDGSQQGGIYDAELAEKWISPRHPHVVETSPGKCRVCGIDLVPASQFGYTNAPIASGLTLVVPRNAVLRAGGNSVVYVETEPGRFELRPVVLGASSGQQIAVLRGVQEGERVATQGNFLIDSQMQLAGNPSLIDPTKFVPGSEPQSDDAEDDTESAAIAAALSTLSTEDRALAEQQKICPVTKMPLGSMGPPPKLEIDGRWVFLCCDGCEAALRADPERHLANLVAEDYAEEQTEGETLPEMDLPTMDLPEMDAEEQR